MVSMDFWLAILMHDEFPLHDCCMTVVHLDSGFDIKYKMNHSLSVLCEWPLRYTNQTSMDNGSTQLSLAACYKTPGLVYSLYCQGCEKYIFDSGWHWNCIGCVLLCLFVLFPLKNCQFSTGLLVNIFVHKQNI